MQDLTLIEIKEPRIPSVWNFDKSVQISQELIINWKKVTIELATELHIARLALSKQGARTDIKEARTWEDYCKELGIAKSTANRWIDRFFQLRPNEPKLDSPELPKGKYKLIYADPPWKYENEQHGLEKQDTVLASHYPSMPTEEICKLPIADLAYKNSVLFLWTTSPKLFEAKEVIDAWGFEYKSSMIWDKVKHNVGYYVSVRHEFLLICTKGSCLPDSNKLIDSVVTVERTEHSKKPDIFYEIIENMYQGKKIELYRKK